MKDLGFYDIIPTGDEKVVKEILETKEKRVEYTELIYDLIFVYIIGRNNSLLHNISGGFVDAWTFLNYIFCTLAIIQIWNYTTYYVNVYGRNSKRDHIMMFVNMFLMYFIGEATRPDWGKYHTQYNIAWALILINLALQYIIEYKNHKTEPAHQKRIRNMALVILLEAAIVLLSVIEFNKFGTSYLTMAAIILSMVLVFFTNGKHSHGVMFIDFGHLTERVMLYVVFTFGEMIIAIASYFKGDFNLNSLYFSAMAFLIVVGLFLSYGIFYDHIVDREKKTNGVGYMIVHIFIIFALNNITTALEFMRNDAVNLVAKILFITLSLILFYACMLSAGSYTKITCRLTKRFIFLATMSAALFVIIMFLLRYNMYLNIALTVIFVFLVFALFNIFAKKGAREK